ncbi:hypothetical protein [Thiosulfatihalobacter marinus]|uniref:hypothetical protein n=1 Tax=Thiosulfatihalobacter marinus TaxID=2792481 RepID=UPI0018D95E83|nr:hypothetical protein [Thiosulfatihalobacter marinus]
MGSVWPFCPVVARSGSSGSGRKPAAAAVFFLIVTFSRFDKGGKEIARTGAGYACFRPKMSVPPGVARQKVPHGAALNLGLQDWKGVGWLACKGVPGFDGGTHVGAGITGTDTKIVLGIIMHIMQ